MVRATEEFCGRELDCASSTTMLTELVAGFYFKLKPLLKKKHRIDVWSFVFINPVLGLLQTLEHLAEMWESF